MTILPCTVDEIEAAPELAALNAEFIAESQRVTELVGKMNFATYRALEAAGILTILGAFDGDTLVGFFFLIVNESPHYVGKVGAAELFFVSKPYRKGGAGSMLLRAAEEAARDAGAVCMVIAAPTGGSLETVAPRWGYAPIDTVLAKGLA